MASTSESGTPTPTPGASAAEPGSGDGNGDQTLAPDARDVALRLNPEATANTLGEYMRAWVLRIRNGDSGMLPVIGGLVLIVVIFQSQKSVFLSAANLTNLFTQAATFILFAMAEVFVLLLGEIDLSIGYVGGVSAVVAVATAAPPGNHPWWVAILAGLAVGGAIGAIQGTLITRLRVPSFVVTLAGLLGWQGMLIFLANREGGTNGGGTLRVTNKIMSDLVNGNLSVAAGWVLLIVGLVGFAAFTFVRDGQRRRHGLVVPPVGLAVLRILVVTAAGLAVVLICNTNRGRIASHPVRGVPWVVLVILGTFALWTVLLGRTRFGRYIYAIGGNAEAARRAGINLNRVRTAAFTLTGITAGLAGIILASQLGSISQDVDGGQLVLYAVAAAVIGGTSLFGGRGRMLYAVVGGLVIATIANGMGLIGLSADSQFMVTALVLLAAATVDAIARRNTTTR
jgi:D-xylose transport system permease protein